MSIDTSHARRCGHQAHRGGLQPSTPAGRPYMVSLGRQIVGDWGRGGQDRKRKQTEASEAKTAQQGSQATSRRPQKGTQASDTAGSTPAPSGRPLLQCLQTPDHTVRSTEGGGAICGEASCFLQNGTTGKTNTCRKLSICQILRVGPSGPCRRQNSAQNEGGTDGMKARSTTR